jgi:predicted transposase YbfD/YdcC
MDDATTRLGISVYFEDLADPRRAHLRRHDLMDVIVITLCAVICGCETWEDVALWGRSKYEWLKPYLRLPNGIPSHDTFNRVFRLLDPGPFDAGVRAWVADLHRVLGLTTIAIDGKTLRHSVDTASAKTALQVVSAWSVENGLSLGQVAVEDGSNEITAIPKLLDLLDVSGCLVTIDAVGCQTEIAAKVRDRGGDYVLALKGNQPTLHQAVLGRFRAGIETGFAGLAYEYHTVTETGHGRTDERTCEVLTGVTGLPEQERWADLKSIICVTRISRPGRPGGVETSEVRYYIASREAGAAAFAKAIRDHWAIENTLHWTLDVTFREDTSRTRLGHGQENLAVLRRLAVSLLKQDASTKGSIKGKTKLAGWDNDFLLGVLLNKPLKK